MAQQPGQQQQGDNAFAPFWIIGLIFLFGMLIWYVAHQHIVAFVFKISLIEAKLLNFFVHNKNLENDIFILQTIDPAAVTWDQMNDMILEIGSFMRYPVIVLLSILALILYRSDITVRYRQIHDMKSLRTQEQRNWPAIMPVLKNNLETEDISSGPWAMALTPMEFSRKYNLLKRDDVLLDSPSPGKEMTAGIRRGDAKRIFTIQLGAYWTDFNHVPAHTKALAAVFMARINRDRTAAANILAEIDKTYAQGKANFDVALETLNRYKDTEIVQKILHRHAYVLTVMASLLETARQDGVAASSEFLWLKPVDRRLWYMLNCVGRQTPFAEVGGPFAHWKAEKLVGRALLIPMIDEAINALEIAVKEVKLTPQEMGELKP